MNLIIRYILAFILYLVFQVVLFDHLILFNTARPFIFLLFLFTLPFDWPILLVYLLAFGTGLTVDIFSESTASGLHAFSALLAIGLRPRVALLASSSSFRAGISELQIKDQSAFWLVTYLLPLVFIHHLAYFYLEAMSFQNFFSTLLQVISSTLYTFSLCFLLSFIFYKR